MKRIGLIAEDSSDVEVINELTKKIAEGRQFTIKKFVGHGCGKIRGKCLQWAQILKDLRCSSIILLHDLDNKNLPELEKQLSDSFHPCPIKKNAIIIPVQEIEAWLLSDEVAIRKALNLKDNVTRVANPEAIVDPKKRLEEIIYLRSGKTKRYINTIHNRRIATEISLSKLRRCKSFSPLEKFLHENL
jgi:hypothetical protein